MLFPRLRPGNLRDPAPQRRLKSPSLSRVPESCSCVRAAATPRTKLPPRLSAKGTSGRSLRAPCPGLAPQRSGHRRACSASAYLLLVGPPAAAELALSLRRARPQSVPPAGRRGEDCPGGAQKRESAPDAPAGPATTKPRPWLWPLRAPPQFPPLRKVRGDVGAAPAADVTRVLAS